VRQLGLFAAALTMISASSAVSAARADDTSTQPYIDSLKQGMKSDDSEGYSEQQKQKLQPEPSSDGYTEQLRQADPSLQLQGTPPPSYSEQQKEQLPPKKQDGAIEAFNEGKSDLKKIKSTDIHSAIGARVGAFVSRSYTANFGIGTGREFTNVYGSGFSPDVSLFGEHQFSHSESGGSIGAFAMIDITRFSGTGTFAVPITSGYNGSTYPANATGVTYYFWDFPLTAGAVFRFNRWHWARPYATIGPTLIPFWEYRSDGGPTHRGLSFGASGSVGMAFLLDGISKDVDWDAYADAGIKHTYFTVEFAGTECLSNVSAITFNSNGLQLGFTFEY
jgi:hypothetical protein